MCDQVITRDLACKGAILCLKQLTLLRAVLPRYHLNTSLRSASADARHILTTHMRHEQE